MPQAVPAQSVNGMDIRVHPRISVWNKMRHNAAFSFPAPYPARASARANRLCAKRRKEGTSEREADMGGGVGKKIKKIDCSWISIIFLLQKSENF